MKSDLAKLIDWLKLFFTNNVVGWIYASNSILAGIAFYFTESIGEAVLAVFFFLIALVFWNRSDLEIK